MDWLSTICILQQNIVKFGKKGVIVVIKIKKKDTIFSKYEKLPANNWSQ